jgi:hypothetical protein
MTTRRPPPKAVQISTLSVEDQVRAVALLRRRGALGPPRSALAGGGEAAENGRGGRLWCEHRDIVRPPRPKNAVKGTPADSGDPGDVVEVLDGFERDRRGRLARDDNGEPISRMVQICGVCTAAVAAAGGAAAADVAGGA